MDRTRFPGKQWIVLFLLFQSLFAMAQPGPLQAGCGWSGGWPMMGGGWGFWWVFPLLMFGGMVLLFAFFMLHGPWSHRGWHGSVSRSALMLLSERFARGEISKEEFEEKKAILVRHP